MKASLPQLWGVLYAKPNEDGERKNCANCQFLEDGECEVLGMAVKDDQVCGYHVPSGEYADPELAGLETVDGGTSCDRCRFYDNGRCQAVEDESGEACRGRSQGMLCEVGEVMTAFDAYLKLSRLAMTPSCRLPDAAFQWIRYWYFVSS